MVLIFLKIEYNLEGVNEIGLTRVASFKMNVNFCLRTTLTRSSAMAARKAFLWPSIQKLSQHPVDSKESSANRKARYRWLGSGI